MFLYIIRHGQSRENDKSSKSNDSRLTDIGLQQATLTGRRLAQADPPPDRIVASPASRTMETASRIASGCRAPVYVEPLVCEYGRLYDDPGMSGRELRERYPEVILPEGFPEDRGWAADTDGETKDSLRARVTEAGVLMAEGLPADVRSVAIVTHAHFSGFFIGTTMGIPQETLSENRIRLFNCGITCIEFTSTFKIMWYSNSTEHLGDIRTAERSSVWTEEPERSGHSM